LITQVLRQHVDFYNEQGWSIIPITYPKGGYQDGKRPAINQWMSYMSRRATKSEQDKWWSDEADLIPNIGIVTGRVSNLAILDIDNETAYNSLTQSNGQLADTLTVKTGKGYHIYFVPDEHRRTCTFMLDGNVHHLKQESSYVVAAPSLHLTGKIYTIVNSRPLATWAIDDVQQWITNANGEFTANQNRANRPVDWASELCDSVPEGQRNTVAAQLCGLLVRKFPYDQGLTLGLMRAWNLTYCKPSLEEGELTHLVEGEYRRYGPKSN